MERALQLAVLVCVGGTMFALPFAAFYLPVVGAFRRGLTVARDPMQRVTPEGAWEVFDRVVWRRLGWWGVLYAGILFAALLSGPFLHIILAPLADRFRPLSLYALVYPAHVAGTWLMIFGLCTFWAPRSSPLVLPRRVFSSLFSIQALMILLAYVIWRGGPWIDLLTPEPLIPFGVGTLVVGISGAGSLWVSARRSGDAWFRLEE